MVLGGILHNYLLGQREICVIFTFVLALNAAGPLFLYALSRTGKLESAVLRHTAHRRASWEGLLKQAHPTSVVFH